MSQDLTVAATQTPVTAPGFAPAPVQAQVTAPVAKASAAAIDAKEAPRPSANLTGASVPSTSLGNATVLTPYPPIFPPSYPPATPPTFPGDPRLPRDPRFPKPRDPRFPKRRDPWFPRPFEPTLPRIPRSWPRPGKPFFIG